MASPTRRPRARAPYPKLFGRNPEQKWEPPAGDPEEGAAHRAARLQDHVARAIRTHLHDEGVKQSLLAERIEWGEERLSRVLTGHSVMSLADMYLLLGAIGSSLTKVIFDSGGAEMEKRFRARAVLSYLDEQREIVRAETSDTARERP